MNLLKRLFPECNKKQVKAMKNKVVNGRRKDISDLKLFNKNFKRVIKNGQLEVKVNNIKGAVAGIK